MFRLLAVSLLAESDVPFASCVLVEGERCSVCEAVSIAFRWSVCLVTSSLVRRRPPTHAVGLLIH